jgi:ABC-type nitrate/sulfonate/bicarbonate transport system substrate-binding protein
MNALPLFPATMVYSRRVTHVRFYVFCLIVLLAWNLAPAAHAQERTKIAVGYSAIAVSQVVPWIMREARLFEKYGLNADLIYLGGARVGPAMVSGDLHIAQVGGDNVVRSSINGYGMIYIGGTNNRFNFSLITHPDINRVEDLKGMNFGVTQVNSSIGFCARLVLKRFGLNPDKDVRIFQTGGNPESLAALQAGVIQATLLSPPLNLKAQSLGFKELIDVAKLAIPYPSTGIGTTRSFVKNNRDAALRYLMGYIEGLNLFFTNKKIAEEVIKKYTHITDPQTLDVTYDYGLKIVERVPRPTLEGLQTVLDVVSAEDPRAKNYRPADFVDLSLLQELEKRGFIKKFSAP